jgi:gliding motility-associated-like protein
MIIYTNVCFGDTLTFTAPDGYSSYEWRENNGSGAVVDVSPAIRQTVGGDYTYVVRVQNADGCWSEFGAPVTGTVYALPATPDINLVATDVCSGDSLLFITNEGYIAYEWVETGTVDTIHTAVGYIVCTDVGSYSYRVRVTDGRGCVSAGYSSVLTGEVYALPVLIPADVSTDVATCPGVAIAVPVSYTLGGSAAGYTVVGLPAGVTATHSGNGIIIGGAPDAGEQGLYEYRIETVNPYGCANASAGGRITVYAPALPPELYALGARRICRGDSVTLVASGTDARAFRWSRDGQPLTGVTGDRYTAGDGGTYAVIIENSRGCLSAANALTVTLNDRPATPVLTTAGASAVICDGESLLLSVDTPQAGITFQWYCYGRLLATADSTCEARTAGVYTVVPLNAQGCEGAESNAITVTLNPRPDTPAITITGPTSFCEGDVAATLHAVANGAATFRWFNDDVLIPDATTAALYAAAAGHYDVEAVSAEGCTSARSEKIEITTYKRPSNVRLTGAPPAFCRGDSVRLTATSDIGTTYRWFLNGAPLAYDVDTYIATRAGLYQIEAVSGYGCVSARNEGLTVVLYDVPNTPVVTLAGAPTFCVGDAATLIATAAGASTFSWLRDGVLLSTGVAHTLTVAEPGNYTVRVTNTAGCTSTESAAQNITVEDHPPAPLIDHETWLRRMRGAAVTLRVTNVNDACRYQWYKDNRETGIAGETTLSIAPLRPSDGGVYKVRVATPLAGCINESQTINLIVTDDIAVGNIITPNGDEYNEYFHIESLDTFAAHEICIINRYGNEVFRTTSYRSDPQNGWRGENLPDGVYFYKISLTDPDDVIISKTGYIVLKRE